jgi:hypothetical protein
MKLMQAASEVAVSGVVVNNSELSTQQVESYCGI